MVIGDEILAGSITDTNTPVCLPLCLCFAALLSLPPVSLLENSSVLVMPDYLSSPRCSGWRGYCTGARIFLALLLIWHLLTAWKPGTALLLISSFSTH